MYECSPIHLFAHQNTELVILSYLIQFHIWKKKGKTINITKYCTSWFFHSIKKIKKFECKNIYTSCLFQFVFVSITRKDINEHFIFLFLFHDFLFPYFLFWNSEMNRNLFSSQGLQVFDTHTHTGYIYSGIWSM